jgi:hypothetical protein
MSRPLFGKFDFPALLEHLTGRGGWKAIAGPGTNHGQNYWFERGEEDVEGMFINVDQSEMTIEISHATGSSDRLYSGNYENDSSITRFISKG